MNKQSKANTVMKKMSFSYFKPGFRSPMNFFGID